MMKKLISLLIILMIAMSAFSSCAKEAEEGTIEPVEINPPETSESAESGFKKMDSPYDYDYTSFTIKKAHMKIDVPSSWNAKFVNSRFAQIISPVDDPYLPGISINILCNYGIDVETNELSEYTMNDRAYTFSSYFKDELEGLPFYVHDIKLHLRNYETEDSINNNLDFTDDEHATDAATLTMDKVVMMDKTERYYTDMFSMITTYVKWNHFPVCFSAVADIENTEKAKKMVEYIASSMSYEKSDWDGYTAAETDGFTTTVPIAFTPLEGAENVFVSYLTQNHVMSGMSLGIFDVESGGKINEDTIAENYGKKIASAAFSPYDIKPKYGMSVFESEEGQSYAGSIFADCTTLGSEAYAGSVFGSVGYYKADYYLIDQGDRNFLVSVIYQDCQKDIAKAVGETAIKNLKAN